MIRKFRKYMVPIPMERGIKVVLPPPSNDNPTTRLKWVLHLKLWSTLRYPISEGSEISRTVVLLQTIAELLMKSRYRLCSTPKRVFRLEILASLAFGTAALDIRRAVVQPFRFPPCTCSLGIPSMLVIRSMTH